METKELISILELLNNKKQVTHVQNEHPFKIGSKYFIRTVTNYYTGKLKDIKGKFLVFENICWIPDTGRFADALKSGNFDEVEPMPEGTGVNMDAIIDYSEAAFKLPKEKK